MYVCVCFCMCMGTHVYVYACGGPRLLSGIASSIFFYLIQWGSISQSNIDHNNGPICGCLSLPRLELEAGHHVHQTFMWAGDLTPLLTLVQQRVQTQSLLLRPLVPVSYTHQTTPCEWQVPQWPDYLCDTVNPPCDCPGVMFNAPYCWTVRLFLIVWDSKLWSSVFVISDELRDH